MNDQPFPALAVPYDPYKVRIPCYVQPKVNGVRCMVAPDGKCYTRSFRELAHLDGHFGTWNFWRDGELFHPEVRLQTLCGWLNRSEWHEDLKCIRLYWFDYVDSAPFSVRAERMAYYGAPQHVVKVPTELITSHSQLELGWLAAIKDPTLEGLIYRDADAPYAGGKCAHVMKRKRMHTAEFKCIGTVEGLGKFSGMLGAFVCETNDGAVFTCGGGALTVADRKQFWSVRPVGEYLTLEYPETSIKGVPLRAQFLCIRKGL